MNKPSASHEHKYTKYKEPPSTMVLMCIKNT